MTNRLLVIISIAICITLVSTSCSSGPPAPQKGTPTFYWQAANDSFGAGDYMKTNDHLNAIMRTENEFTARATAWRLVLTAGMAKGFMELADNFEYGARANKTNPTPFRKQVNTYRTYAANLSLQFLETFQKFQQSNKDAKVPLAFNYPTGSAAPVPLLTKVGAGMLPQETEVADGQKRNLERAVLLATCASVGAPEDTAKAQQAFKTSPVEVTREAFILAMASALNDQADIFSRSKMDRPDRVKMVAGQAAEAVKTLPESAETKALAEKIEKTLKAAN